MENGSKGTSHGSPKRLTLSFLMSISSLVALCAKHSSRVTTKLKTLQHDVVHSRKIVRRPKKLMTQISNKVGITLLIKCHKKHAGEGGWSPRYKEEEEEEFGSGGVWQKEILMGDKCQPLDFSGVIYYDSNGKLLNQVPLRSPRASPLPSYLSHVG